MSEDNSTTTVPVTPVAMSTPPLSAGSNNNPESRQGKYNNNNNNNNRSYNGQRQHYHKNYNKNNNSSGNVNSSNGYNNNNSKYVLNNYTNGTKNRSSNYNNNNNNNNINNNINNSGRKSGYNNTNRFNDGSRFSSSQYYNQNMNGSDDIMHAQQQQQQQQPNMTWPGYFVPQMYYIPQQMAAAMAAGSIPTTNINDNTLNPNDNNSISPSMTSPTIPMATLNSNVPLMPTQSPPMVAIPGTHSRNGSINNTTSPIMPHISPMLSPPKKKVEITTKTGEKLDLSQIHNQSKNSSNVPSNSTSPHIENNISLNIDSISSTEKIETINESKETNVTNEEEKLSEAEKNKRAFLEQVRLRKLAMDKKKQLETSKDNNDNDDHNKGNDELEVQVENDITESTTQEDTTETTKEDTIEEEEEDKIVDEENIQESNEKEVTKDDIPKEEHIMTFTEKLKLKHHHDTETNENDELGKTSSETTTTNNTTTTTITTTTTTATSTVPSSEGDHKEDNQHVEGDSITTEEVSEVTEENDERIKMTTFINKINSVPPIDDIFAFKYPDEFESPDTKYKKPHVKYTYGPTFLLQFKDKVKCKPDQEWIDSTQSKIVILPSMNKQRNRVNFAGGADGNRAGSMRNLDGRANSRVNSKRQSSKRFDERKSNRSSYTPRSERMANRSRRDTNRKGDNFAPNKTEPPKEEVAPFVPSANRWVPKSRAKKTEKKLAPDGVTELFDHEEVQRKMKSLLNKLTLEKFDPISADIIAIANQSQWETNGDTLSNVIEQIFLKACDEPYWSSMYAQLCGKIVKDVNPEISDENNEGKIGPKLVLHYLVDRCHREFEKGWTDKLPTNEDGSPLEPEMMSDEYYVLAAAKRRGLGLVRFIGFLYRLNLLTGRMMFECFRRLMKDIDDNVSEETLESVVELLTTVGAQFESDSFSMGKGSLPGSVLFDKLFQLLQDVIDKEKVSNRIRFKLIDVKELREDKHWNSEKTNQGPKTIQEIHDEEEKARQEKAANSRAPSRRGGNNNYSHNYSNRNGLRRDLSRDNFNNNNFNSHSYSSRNSQFSSHSNTQRFNNRNITKEEKPAPSHASNRFDALMHAGDD